MLEKRSLTLSGHRTSIALEAPFWAALSEIAQADSVSLLSLVSNIDQQRRPEQKLASALRLHVLHALSKHSPPDRS